MPASGPLSDAALSAPFTSSRLVSRFGVKVRSTRLTLGVGTRIAEPSSLPFSSGSTSPTARAAPGVGGIIARPAARRRADRGSVELALQLGKHLADGAGGAGRGRDHRHSGGPGAAHVGVDLVED